MNTIVIMGKDTKKIRNSKGKSNGRTLGGHWAGGDRKPKRPEEKPEDIRGTEPKNHNAPLIGARPERSTDRPQGGRGEHGARATAAAGAPRTGRAATTSADPTAPRRAGRARGRRPPRPQARPPPPPRPKARTHTDRPDRPAKSGNDATGRGMATRGTTPN